VTPNGISESDIFASVIIIAAFVMAAGIVGRWLTNRFGQPAVLGELLIGMFVGNIGYWAGAPVFLVIMHLTEVAEIFSKVWLSGLSIIEATKQVLREGGLGLGEVGTQLGAVLIGPSGPILVVTGITLWLFSSLGVLFLLFLVGLESSPGEMRQLGPRPILVATIGVMAPLGLGYMAIWWLLPESPHAVHLFVAATLSATSVGITARVLRDLGKQKTPEALLVLGAAVIDDILGLIILALVVGIVTTGEFRVAELLRISLLSLVFFGVLFIAGDRIVHWGIRLFRALDHHTYKLIFPVVLMLTTAWLANVIGLAAIVGAFAAGLVLNEEKFARYPDPGPTLQDIISPLQTVFAPLFFVLMGMQVNLASFLEPRVAWLSLVLTVAAVLGKLAAGLPAYGRASPLSVGIGMVPRGEVGLIFAGTGKALGVVGDALFSAIVLMVVATTLAAPPGLKWSFSRAEAAGRTA
jgi:Kef-type K+ transport system membrane component KefB